MKTLFLESVAGVAGDMFAASFVDAGLVSREELQAIPGLLGLDGVTVEITNPQRATIRATHVDVKLGGDGWKKHFRSAHASVMNPKAAAHWHAYYVELDRFLEKSKLEAGTKDFARKVFRLLGEAEAAAHGTSLEDVAFHEVGAVDSVVDVVMAAHCVSRVAPDRILATPVKLGRGTITIEHGTQPVPPPASARLVVGMPTSETPPAIARANVELSTPTGLAILKALAPQFVDAVPAGTVRAQGSGAGTMDLGAYPNIFRTMVVEGSGASAGAGALSAFEADSVREICCNMDDETAERTAWVMEKLMTMGALDVWATPVTGKKGRAAIMLSVLAEEKSWSGLADWLLRHSSTFGLRHRQWDRVKLARKIETRQTADGPVRYKVGMTTTGEVVKEKPEFEDLRKIWDRG